MVKTGKWLLEVVLSMLFGVFLLRSPGSAEIYTVTNTQNTDQGSLRWVIDQANLHAGPDTVLFSIPQSDPGFDGTVWQIRPKTNLPDLSGGETVILGGSQTQLRGDKNPDGPEIFLDGREVSGFACGLSISSTGNAVSGLAVSGFSGWGIQISGNTARWNRITGSFIGTNASGKDTLGNGQGVYIGNGAVGNLVGGGGADQWNLLSGNRLSGCIIESDSNTVTGNFIGVDRSGTGALGNGHHGIELCRQAEANRIGGVAAGEANVISANKMAGIVVRDAGTKGNRIIGNRIGTDKRGTARLANTLDGIWICDGAASNIVGGAYFGESNVISGNGGSGVLIEGTGTSQNQLICNWIGTALGGTWAMGNEVAGIFVRSGASSNRIGPGNVVSGNKLNGITLYGTGTGFNAVQGNLVGLDATGRKIVPNGRHGIRLENGARYNTIGGPSRLDRNVVSGNGWSGLATVGDSTGYNVFENNYAGTDVDGTAGLGNVYHGAHFGGVRNVLRNNVFSGNGRCGMMVGGFSKGNVIVNNAIGTGADGVKPLPNKDTGISIGERASADTIGPDNRIRYNGWYGVMLMDSTMTGICITKNSVKSNTNGGIRLLNKANKEFPPPIITGVSPVKGTAEPRSKIEIFSDSTDQGGKFEGAVTADASGKWIWNGIPSGPKVTATATDTLGNTSEFSPGLAASAAEGPGASGSARFSLSQNFPNPYNPETTIRFSAAEPCRVVLKVYDPRGRQVRLLADGMVAPGRHEVRFDAAELPSGIYFCQIRMGDFIGVRKMTVVK